MPELPEVETVARLVAPDVLQKRVTGVCALWRKTGGGRSDAELEAALVGRRFVRVERRAKYILMGLAPDRSKLPDTWLVVHLRMTGRLVVAPAREEPAAHTRFSVELGPRRLDFIDPRKFGRCLVTSDPTHVLPELGPEPLEDGFEAEAFVRDLRARKRQLKPLLLDQAFVAGLGNIYVDEALHRAGLHPLTPAHRVTRPKARALHAAIRTVLAEAIEREGSSFDTFYRTPTGQPGSYQHQFQVYGRQGQPCRTCGGEIQKRVVGQRGTHFCARCQRRR